MKTVFFGTPEWAVPSLEALAGGPHCPALTITQPPRRRARSEVPTASPVGLASQALGIERVEPASIREAEVLDRIARLRADLFVVVAYGEILPRAVLEMPRLGCVNLHFSLLPRYRGAAPVQWAIVDGAVETGVTTMKIVPKLDAGPIYLEERVPVDPEEHAPALGARLALAGARVLVETVGRLERGAVSVREQDPGAATYARILTAEDGWIDWTLTAEAIARRVRGFDPWPGQSSISRRGRVKVLDARAWRIEEIGAGVPGPPGLILGADRSGCCITCGEGSVLELLVVRPEGRRAIAGVEALRGRHLVAGEILGGHDANRP